MSASSPPFWRTFLKADKNRLQSHASATLLTSLDTQIDGGLWTFALTIPGRSGFKVVLLRLTLASLSCLLDSAHLFGSVLALFLVSPLSNDQTPLPTFLQGTRFVHSCLDADQSHHVLFLSPLRSLQIMRWVELPDLSGVPRLQFGSVDVNSARTAVFTVLLARPPFAKRVPVSLCLELTEDCTKELNASVVMDVTKVRAAELLPAEEARELIRQSLEELNIYALVERLLIYPPSYGFSELALVFPKLQFPTDSVLLESTSSIAPQLCNCSDLAKSMLSWHRGDDGERKCAEIVNQDLQTSFEAKSSLLGGGEFCQDLLLWNSKKKALVFQPKAKAKIVFDWCSDIQPQTPSKPRRRKKKPKRRAKKSKERLSIDTKVASVCASHESSSPLSSESPSPKRSIYFSPAVPSAMVSEPSSTAKAPRQSSVIPLPSPTTTASPQSSNHVMESWEKVSHRRKRKIKKAPRPQTTFKGTSSSNVTPKRTAILPTLQPLKQKIIPGGRRWETQKAQVPVVPLGTPLKLNLDILADIQHRTSSAKTSDEIFESNLEPFSKPVVKLAPDPVSEPVSDPAVKLAPEPVSDPAVKLAPDPVSEPAVKLVPDPVSEPAVELAPEPTSELVLESVLEPLSEPVLGLISEPTSESHTTKLAQESCQVLVLEPVLEPVLESVLESVLEPVLEPVPLKSPFELTPKPTSKSTPQSCAKATQKLTQESRANQQITGTTLRHLRNQKKTTRRLQENGSKMYTPVTRTKNQNRKSTLRQIQTDKLLRKSMNNIHAKRKTIQLLLQKNDTLPLQQRMQNLDQQQQQNQQQQQQQNQQQQQQQNQQQQQRQNQQRQQQNQQQWQQQQQAPHTFAVHQPSFMNTHPQPAISSVEGILSSPTPNLYVVAATNKAEVQQDGTVQFTVTEADVVQSQRNSFEDRARWLLGICNDPRCVGCANKLFRRMLLFESKMQAACQTRIFADPTDVNFCLGCHCDNCRSGFLAATAALHLKTTLNLPPGTRVRALLEREGGWVQQLIFQ